MSEIFRHLRPRIGYGEIARNDPKGGVSFLAVRDGQFADYWVYICPLDVPFSHKSAIYHLRKNRKFGVVPWGRITLDERPLIQNLYESASSQEDLQTEIGSIINKIIRTHK